MKARRNQDPRPDPGHRAWPALLVLAATLLVAACVGAPAPIQPMRPPGPGFCALPDSALEHYLINRYEADQPLSFQQQEQGNIAVTRRLVLISVSVEIYDLREDRMLWQRGALRVEGEYEPPGEDERKGRELALERLVVDIVDGAQSQW